MNHSSGLGMFRVSMTHFHGLWRMHQMLAEPTNQFSMAKGSRFSIEDACIPSGIRDINSPAGNPCTEQNPPKMKPANPQFRLIKLYGFVDHSDILPVLYSVLRIVNSPSQAPWDVNCKPTKERIWIVLQMNDISNSHIQPRARLYFVYEVGRRTCFWIRETNRPQPHHPLPCVAFHVGGSS